MYPKCTYTIQIHGASIPDSDEELEDKEELEDWGWDGLPFGD